jgi:hypothetical protein
MEIALTADVAVAQGWWSDVSSRKARSRPLLRIERIEATERALIRMPCRRAISVTTAPGASVSLDDPHLIVARPATPPLNPVQNLYPHQTDLKVSLKATCFRGNLSLNKAAYRGGIPFRRRPPVFGSVISFTCAGRELG